MNISGKHIYNGSYNGRVLWSSRINQLLAFTMLLVVGGCAYRPPSCYAPSTKSMIKEVIINKIANQILDSDREAAAEHRMHLKYARPTNYNGKIEKYSCAADFQIMSDSTVTTPISYSSQEIQGSQLVSLNISDIGIFDKIAIMSAISSIIKQNDLIKQREKTSVAAPSAPLNNTNAASSRPTSNNVLTPPNTLNTNSDQVTPDLERSTSLVRLLPNDGHQVLINTWNHGADAGSSSIRIWTTHSDGKINDQIFFADERDGSLSDSINGAHLKVRGMRMMGCMACGHVGYAVWAWDPNLGGFALWHPNQSNIDFANYLHAPIAVYGQNPLMVHDQQLDKYKKATDKLDVKYNESLINVGKNGAGKLRKSEIYWIEQKRSRCGSTATALAPGQLAALDCLIFETKNRLEYMRYNEQ